MFVNPGFLWARESGSRRNGFRGWGSRGIWEVGGVQGVGSPGARKGLQGGLGRGSVRWRGCGSMGGWSLASKRTGEGQERDTPRTHILIFCHLEILSFFLKTLDYQFEIILFRSLFILLQWTRMHPNGSLF